MNIDTIKNRLKHNTETYLNKIINEKMNKILIIDEDDIKNIMNNIFSNNIREYNSIIESYNDAIFESDKKKLCEILDDNKKKEKIYNDLNIIKIK